MSILFRARLSPNIQRDPDGVLTASFSSPRNADNVTVLVKELDTYADSSGQQVSEGSEDDLLATFTGQIRNRRFEVATHANASTDNTLPTVRIAFQGSDTIYTIPVIVEEGENEDANWEIALVVQYAGQDDYTSPVSFIPLRTGRILVVDNTMGDLDDYEGHANLIRHYFVSRGMEGKIIRGERSRSSVAHYAAADTTDYPGGLNKGIFINEVPEYDYVYFNCHGNIELIDPAGEENFDPCILCDRRFSNNSFNRCSRNTPCVRTQHKGFFEYKLRTTDNAEIRIGGAAGTVQLAEVFFDDQLKEMVHTLVTREDYEAEFLTANAGNADVTTGPPAGLDPAEAAFWTADTIGIRRPGNYQFPTLRAFPTGPSLPDFSVDNLPQNPPSASATDIHITDAEDVPGSSVISFSGDGGPLSDEATATPSASAAAPAEDGALVFTLEETTGTPAATPFTSAPTGITAVPHNRAVTIRWNEVTDAYSYTLYWSESPGVTENSRAINYIWGTEYSHEHLTNNRPYYYKVRARKHSGCLMPNDWGEISDLSRAKIIFAGCCLAGRKISFARAALEAGAKFFIGHQVVTASVSEQLINNFWNNWVQRGAVLRNVINVFNQLTSSSTSYRRTRPVIYYRNTANAVQFWRPGMAPPDPATIKID